MILPAPLQEPWNRFKAWQPNDVQRRRMKIAGFTLYTLTAVVIFTWIQLPWKAISSLVTSQITAWTGRKVSAEDVGLYRISGISFENLTIERSGAVPAQISELALRLEIFPLLLGRTNIQGYALVGGENRFGVRRSSGMVTVDAAFDKMDLAKLFPEGKPTDFALSGSLDGNFNLKAPGSQFTAANFDWSAAEGSVEVTVTKGLVKGVNAGSLPIPQLHFDDWRVSLQVKDGRIEVQKFDLQGPDADISIEGQISAQAPTANSRLNLRLKVTPKGEFARSYGALLGTQMRQEAGGSLGAYLQGTLGAPQIRQ